MASDHALIPAQEFGDLADPRSRVARLHSGREKRKYAMLAELNVRPRNLYLARIRNPHPILEPAKKASQGHPEGHSDEHGSH